MKYRTGIVHIFGIVLVLLAVPCIAQTTAPSTLPSEIQEPLSALEKDAKLEKDPAAPYNRWIQYLGTLYVGTTDEQAYYNRILDKIASLKSAESLPALEAFLNRDIWGYPRDNIDMYLQRFRDKASKIWYEIKWQNASEKEKIKTAFYGLEPDSPVKAESGISRDKVEEIGAPAREYFYALLENDKLGYGDNAWYVRGLSAAADLLARPEFAPTDQEITRILNQGGDWGKTVMMFYLLKDKQDPRVIPALLKWFDIHKADSRKLDLLLGDSHFLSQAPAAQKDKLIQGIITIGLRVQQQCKDKHFKELNIFDHFSLLYDVNFELYKLGFTPQSADYLKGYVKFRKDFDVEAFKQSMDGETGYIAACLGTLGFADKYAQEALQQWKLKM